VKGLDPERLRAYLGGERELTARMFAGGRSNLTYAVTDGEQRWVLRRPPLGHVLPSAHDMAREYTVLRALRDTAVPVPLAEALCADPDVIGAPFYVMTRVDGVILRTAADTAALTAAQAEALSTHFVDALVKIHAVDWRAAGLAGFGRPDGYLERQIRRWGQQWERSKTRELPALTELAGWLRAHVPPAAPATLVHGDYRLDNVVLSPGSLAVAAVLDWEMSTLGDPLADLGLLAVYWSGPHDEPPAPSAARQVAGNPGFLSRDALVEEYARRSGRDLSALRFYVALGYFKFAVILEGIHRRYTMGQTLGAGFDQFGAEVPGLVEAGLAATARANW
jgi:aminoglycoside phosphotransferase (APT) family kinase protein